MLVAGVVAVLVGLGAFVAVMAQTVLLDIEHVASNNAYTEVTVVFTRGAYAPFTPPEGDDEPVLAAIPDSSFVIADDDGSVVPTSVVWDAASPTQYVFTFAAAVTPNETTIVVPVGQATDDEGTLNAQELVGVVTLTAADARAAATALAEVELDLKGLGAIPFVGAWFANEGATVVSEVTVQMEAAAAELTDTALQASAVTEARPRPLADLLPDLAALDLADAESQQEVIELLETLVGVDEASFTGEHLQLTFAPDTAAAAVDLASTQPTATPEGGTVSLPFEVDATTTFGLDLAGSLAIDLPLAGTAGVTVEDLELRPRDLSVAVDRARIGILGVSAPGLEVVTTDLVGTVTSCADCTGPVDASVGLIPTLAGDVALVIPALAFDGAAAEVADSFTFADAPTVTWNLDDWDLEQDEPNPAPSTVTNAAEFFAAGLHQFVNLDTRAVVLGLGWVSSWLAATGELDELATKLPGLGLSIDDVLALSDQIGAEVTRLAELVEGDPSAAQPTDPTAQELVDLLCQSELLPCETGWEQDLDGLAISPDAITYDLEFDVCKVLFVTPDSEGSLPTPTCSEPGDPTGVDVRDGGPQLDLELADDLEGIDVSLRAGTWSGTASATLSVRLALDLRPDAELIHDLNLTPEDYPQPATPLTHQLRVGELCRTLPLALPGDTTPTAFLLANDLTPGVVADQITCDRLAFATSGFASVQLTDPADPEGTVAHQLTAAEVCEAAALVWDVDATFFRELNNYETDAACATAVRTAVNLTPVNDPADAAAPQLYPSADFTYREPIDTSRVPIGFRVYIEPIGTEPLVDASVSITGSDLGADVRLGFLDLDLTGDATATPRATLTLTDPSDSAGVDATRFDLTTLARIADDGDLAQAFTVAVAGPIDVNLTLANPVAFPTAPAQLRFQEDLANVLDGTWASSSSATSCEDATVGLCYTLGGWTQLRDLSPFAAVQMVTGVLDQVSGLASADDLNLEVPLLGVSLQDMVEFNRSVNSVVGAVESRDPELLTQLQRAIEAGVSALGVDLSEEEVTVELVQINDNTALTVEIPFVYRTSTDYPFSLDLGADLPFAIEPADGGARLTAGAQITYRPRVGVILDGGTSDPFVLDISSARDPVLSATAGGELSGDVTAGPAGVYLYGTASATPTATIELSGLSTEHWLTATEISNLPASSFTSSLLAVSGDLSLDASIDWPFGADPTIAWNATLAQVLAGETGTLEVSPDWDVSGITLDLETLVRGTTQTARFVGQGLASSEAMGTSLPLVGDELTKLATAGRDLQTIAVIVEDLWEEAQRESDRFVADANQTLQDEVCTALEAVGDCEVTLELRDSDGDPSGIAAAQSAVLTFDIGKTVNVEVGGAQLLDVPGLDIEITDASFAPQASIGYRLGFVLGLDMTDGFYLEGLAIDDEPTVTRLLELFASADLGTSIPAGTTPSVQVGGVPIFDLIALDLALSGSLDGGTAAGFALDLPQRLTLRDLVSRRGAFDRVLTPTLSLDSSALITVRSPEAFDGLPTVVFPLHFAWEFDEELRRGLVLPEPFLSIGHPDEDEDSYVTVDATSLIEGVIRPALLEGAQYNPLASADPVRDALNTQIPVIDTDVRSALEVALGREPSWQLFTFLLDLEDIADSIREVGPAQPYDIGGYQVLPSAERGYFEADPDATLWDEPEFAALRVLIDRVSRLSGSGTFDPGPQTVPDAPGDAPRPGSADLSGAPTSSQGAGQLSQFVSLPALSEPLSLATLVLGGEVAQDISFLEVSPPPIAFGKAIRFDQTLFDLDIAFLEANLSVALDGAVGVTLRIGFGYSSRGLTSGNPLYGIYLVDAYDGDRDLPAIALGARISARVDGRFAIAVAGIDVASARFRGSGYVRLEGGVDLFDESLAISARGRGDGMFHLDEIATVVASHRISARAPAATAALCIFRPVVQLDAGLRFSGEARALGVKVWSGSFGDDWILVDESVNCPYKYRVAQLEERRLILNAGPQYAADRFDERGDVDESFRIRQAGGALHVQWTGPNAAEYDELSFPLDEVDEIYGDLGAGNDEVIIESSVTVPAVLDGGPGNDILLGGSGDDQIDGGPGRNYLAGGGGNNLLIAGPDGPAGDPTGGAGTLGICDGSPGTLALARSAQANASGCTVVVAGTGDDVLEGGLRPVVYRLPGNTFGDLVVDHLGDNAVLDLRDADLGVRGTVSQAGISLRARSGTGSVSAFDAGSVVRLIGTAGDDRLTLTAGRDELFVDGANGADEIIVQATAVSQSVTVTDSGTDGEDTLIVRGTSGADRYLLRAERSPDAVGEGLAADRGIVAVLDPRSGTDAGPAPGGTDLQDTDTDPVTYTGRADASQLVRYDSSIELLQVDGVAGQNEFGLDDVATETIIDGGRGSGVGQPGNRFQVGQIFGWYADEKDPGEDDQAPFRVPLLPTDPVTNAVDDIELRTRESIRGWISYGITHETTINGGIGDDAFTVYSNRDTLNLNGISGDNVFTLRAFIENGSIRVVGGDGDDTFNYDFEYVDNEEVNIDGGDGFNTFVAIGTELQDGFVVREDGVSVCRIAGSAGGLDERVTRDGVVTRLPLQPDDAGIGEGDCGIRSTTTNIQRFVLFGLEGNNAFWVRSTVADSETFVIGGAHGSTYLLGDEGDLSGLAGTVDVVGDLLNLSQRAEGALQAVDLDFPPPVLFDGEIAYSPVDAMIPADAVDLDAEHRIVADASEMNQGEDGDLLSEPSGGDDDAFGGRVTGLSTAAAGTFTVGAQASYPGGIGYRGVDLLRVVLGGGADTFEVEDTHPAYTIDPLGDGVEFSRDGRTELLAGGGNDTLSIDAISGRTWVELEAGTNELTVGTGVVSGIAEDLEVLGGDGDDTVIVDASNGSVSGVRDLRADLDLRRNEPDSRATIYDRDPVVSRDVAELTELGMAGLLRHDAAIGTLRLLTGDGDDVFNIRGALAGVTELVAAGADDRFFVSDEAAYDTNADTPAFLAGTLFDLVGDLDIDAGAGTNLLMVSDLDGEVGLTGTVDRDEIALHGVGAITYDASGTFAGGITLWTSEHDDVIDVVGVRRDGDPTTLAWTGRSEGGARTITTLNTGGGDDDVTVDIDAAADGLLVVNLGDGDDTLDGLDSTLGFIVFGGAGDDELTTGSGDDIVFGDHGTVRYLDGTAVVTNLGDDRLANVNDGVARAPASIRTIAPEGEEPGRDTVVIAAGDNVVFGGSDDDVITTGDGHDVVFGDHGMFNWEASLSRPGDLRTTAVDLDGAGDNLIRVGGGDDVVFGGIGNNRIEATSGRNALIGDHGRVWRDDDPQAVEVRTSDGFLDEVVRDADFVYDVDVFDDEGGGADVILGGSDGDVIFGGPGNDVIVGTPGEGEDTTVDSLEDVEVARPAGDIIFAGDGDDIVWGGPGDDRIYGGNGRNIIDIKRPAFDANLTERVHDEAWWNAAWELAPAVDAMPQPDRHNGFDLIYGGRGQDVIQVDAGGPGQQAGDRAINWYGQYNLFLTCDGAFGAGQILRQPSPGLPEALIALAEADGAYGASDTASSGWRQLALVTREYAGENRGSPHPDNPGNNATC